MQGLRPVEPRSMHIEVQERLKEYILGTGLQPGDPLPTESQLSEQLCVSRTVVREALRSLESLGVIYSRRGEGRFVSRFNLDPIVQNLGYSIMFDEETMGELLAVRERLEAGFIGAAIDSMDEERLEELRTIISVWREKVQSGEDFAQEDKAFHTTLYQGLGNRLLLKLLEAFWEVHQNLRNQSLRIPQDPLREVSNHEAILQAIEIGDVRLAQERIVNHFDNVRARLQRSRSVDASTEAAAPERGDFAARRGATPT